MKPIIILTAILFSCIFCYAQDELILKNGNEEKVKVLDVGTTEIKYKKFDNLDGPTFTILKSDVFIIKYQNGEKDVINDMETGKKTIAQPGSHNFMNAFEVKDKGYCGIAEIGTNIVFTQVGSNPVFSFKFFNGGRLSKNLALGFQTGVDVGSAYIPAFDETIKIVIVPATFALRASFLNKRVTPFLDFNVGFNYLSVVQTDAYGDPPIGDTYCGVTFMLSVGGKFWVTKALAVTMRLGYNGFGEFSVASNPNGGFGGKFYKSGMPVMFGVEF